MERIFNIPKRDKNGKIQKDSDGNTITSEYVYNYDLMSADRMLIGRKLFHISNKEYNNSPKIEDELSSLVSREAERQGFAAILMKRIEDNEFEKYDSYKCSSFDALSEISGKEKLKELMECQDDFFLRVGLQSPELMNQSVDIMTQCVNIYNGLKQINQGGQDNLFETLKLMLNHDITLQPEPMNENDSTT
jgi:hypothetical protein